MKLLTSESRLNTLADLNAALLSDAEGIDPHEFLRLFEKPPHRVALTYSRSKLGFFDVLIASPTTEECIRDFGSVETPHTVLETYSNTPAQIPDSLPGRLRSFLQEKLPEYMLPSAFVLMENLPRTPNGKLDRRALPESDDDVRPLEKPLVAPGTPLEEALVEIWMEILGVSQMGVQDSFFERGGHSLLATQLVARVRDVFQIRLPLRTIFENPTIAAIAPILQEMESRPGQTTKIAQALKQIRSMTPDERKSLMERAPAKSAIKS